MLWDGQQRANIRIGAKDILCTVMVGKAHEEGGCPRLERGSHHQRDEQSDEESPEGKDPVGVVSEVLASCTAGTFTHHSQRYMSLSLSFRVA